MAIINKYSQPFLLNEQILQQMRIGIERTSGPDMPEPELSPSPVAGDAVPDNCLGLFYHVDVIITLWRNWR